MANHPSILAVRTSGTVQNDKKDMTPKDECPRWEGVQYATGEEQRAITNSSRKNEVTGPKQKRPSAVDVSGDESKIQCCKEQYCIGTWNVRSMNQIKLDVDKQEMVRIKLDLLKESVN